MESVVTGVLTVSLIVFIISSGLYFKEEEEQGGTSRPVGTALVLSAIVMTLSLFLFTCGKGV